MKKLRTKGLIKDGKILVEMFNKHYINIVEKTSGTAPKNLGNPLDPKLDQKTICEIAENYRNHPSIIKIKEIVKEKPIFDFPEATAENLNKIVKSLNPNKATGLDRIPLKIIKTAANVIDSHLAYIINKDLKENKFSENAETALVRPIYKKDDRDRIKSYRPVSLLSGFSKIHERFLHDMLCPKMDLAEMYYLIGKKKVSVKKSRQKIWSVKNLVTCPKFSHFLPTFFLPIRYFHMNTNI